MIEVCWWSSRVSLAGNDSNAWCREKKRLHLPFLKQKMAQSFCWINSLCFSFPCKGEVGQSSGVQSNICGSRGAFVLVVFQVYPNDSMIPSLSAEQEKLFLETLRHILLLLVFLSPNPTLDPRTGWVTFKHGHFYSCLHLFFQNIARVDQSYANHRANTQ